MDGSAPACGDRTALVASARPNLLLADEPTGNLYSARTRETLELLRGICQEDRVPGVLVTHDPEAIWFCRWLSQP